MVECSIDNCNAPYQLHLQTLYCVREDEQVTAAKDNQS